MKLDLKYPCHSKFIITVNVTENRNCHNPNSSNIHIIENKMECF